MWNWSRLVERPRRRCRFLQKPYATRDLGEAMTLLLGANEASEG
jgi:hypothetical protein